MTHRRSKQVLAIVIACIVAFSMTAPFVGAIAAGQHSGQDSIGSSTGIVHQMGNGSQGTSQSNVSDSTRHATSSDQPGATIDPALKNAKGTVVVFARLGKADTTVTASRQATIQTLKHHAEVTQRPVVAFAKKRADGVKVLNEFWITNAVLLRVDTNKVSLKKVATIKGVRRITPNPTLHIPKPPKTKKGVGGSGGVGTYDADTDANQYNTTYGLDQINAPQVWSEYNTMGQGVKVAVLDTGVDIDHPDITLYTEDPGNETYPGGWAEFDAQGEIVPGSVPHAEGPHGTHTSGTVSGSNASGEYIGVAPKVSLMHGLVLPNGGGTLAQITGGIQWAVANGADVISMSFGPQGGGFLPGLIEPIRNAHAAGVITVASIGNAGPGTSGTPGNIYGTIGVGASNKNLGIAQFSSGMVVDTSEDWGSAAPEEWPDTYVVPDVAAPGVAVKSSVPGGGYAKYPGTSMAAPHVAGAIALMLSASGGDLSNEQIKDALYGTAFKPNQCVPSCTPREGKDTRYGAGIINVSAATDQVALDNGITGTVTGPNGTPIEGATVSIPSFSTETNASGQYMLLAEPGTYEVTVTAFGYENASASVTVENGTFTTQNFTLAEALGVRLLDGQADGIQAGNSTTVTVEVANLETYTAELTGDYSTANATLYVNGDQQPFDEPISLGDYSGELNVTVDTAPGTSGEFSIHHTFQGEGDTTKVTTGPTEVFEEFTQVAVVHSDPGYGDQVVAVLEEELPANYQMTLVADQNALEAVGEYETFVMQDVDSSDLDIQAFVEATNSPQIGVVWLDNWGSSSNSIQELSQVTGNPASRSDSFAGNTPVYYNVTQDHPIFAGVADPGETVAIHTASFADRSWFNDFDGQVIATVGAQNSNKGGPAVAVNPQTGTVLAATLGRELFVQNEDFTEAADAILANAVEYASTAPPVVLTSGQAQQIEPGESVQLNFSVSQLDTVRVELADSSTISKENLNLYINGTGPLPFGVTIAEIPPANGKYTITVETTEDATGSLSLVSTFTAGRDDKTVTYETGPTAVYTKPLNVPGEVSSIQQAINLAPRGATIVVAEGTYTENITVYKQNITLRAAEGATPVIRAPENLTDGTVVDITAPSVTFEGFTVEARGVNDGVAVDFGASDVTINDVSVQNANTAIVSDAADATISASTVTNSSTGIAVTNVGTTVSGTTITDTATAIDIGVSGDVDVTNNTVTNSSTAIVVASSTTDIQLSNNVIKNGETGIHIDGGTANVTMNDINAETGILLTGDEFDPVDVHLRYNDLAATDVAVNNTLAEPFDARLNYYGPRGPVNTTIKGNVVHGPFLTAPPEQVDRDETTKIAIDLKMSAGDAYAVGVPGPTQQTVGEIFGDFEGAVYGYDAQSSSWNKLSADSEVGALDALYVQADTDARAVLTFHSSGPVPPVPGQKKLVEGYNFIAPPKYAPIEDAYAVSSADLGLAMNAFTQPSSQLGPPGELEGVYQFGSQKNGPNVSAFTGYYVFAESGGIVPSLLQANPTMKELYDALSVDMDIAKGTSNVLSAQKVDFVSAASKAKATAGAAPPAPPAAYYGTVTRNGHPMPGATVTVKVNGEIRAKTTTDREGSFGEAGVFAKKLLVSGGYSEAGADVQFFVNGRPVDTTITFQPGAVANVTISLDRQRGHTRGVRRSVGPHANSIAKLEQSMTQVGSMQTALTLRAR